MLSTMLPAKPPLSLEDSYLDRAIRVVAEAGEEMRTSREETRQQHHAVLDAIKRSDANQTRNYEMVRDEIRHLKESDRNQDAKLANVTTELANLAGRIDVIERAQLSTALERELGDIRASVLSLIEAVEGMGGTNRTELTGRKVLLVDDHDLILKSMSRIVSSHGATVLTASTLAAVQSVVKTHDPDCVVVDVRLAEGEDGSEIVEWLLARGIDRSRVLLLSGDRSAGTEAAARLGVKLVEKPLSATELVSVIREASNRPS